MTHEVSFLSQVKEVIRSNQLSLNTEKCYLNWIYRFYIYNNKKDPNKFELKEIQEFIQFLAVKRKLSISTQNQAINSINFLYCKVLNTPLKKIYTKSKCPSGDFLNYITRWEIQKILSKLDIVNQLMISLIYGSGLWLNECTRLRIIDFDFSAKLISIRNKLGNISHYTVLPELLVPHLERQINKAKLLWEENILLEDFSGTTLPMEIEKKIPHFAMNIEWQYLFPSAKLFKDPSTGLMKQHHRHGSLLQRELNLAIYKAEMPKCITCNTFRHSFAIHMLEKGYRPDILNNLLGYKNNRSTSKYFKAIDNRKIKLISPIDNW